MKNSIDSALTTDSTMHVIDMNNWERSEHYTFFSSIKSSNFSVTVPQDITELCAYRKKVNKSGKHLRLSDALYFFATKVANAIPEFKTRIVDGNPVIFDKVHPAFTYIPKGRTLHANCLAKYADNYSDQAENIEISRQNADKKPSLTPEGGDKQNLLYFSIAAGVPFTAVTNPWGDCNEDSVPRIIFGQMSETADGKKTIPISLELLHSLADGKHIAQFLKLFGEMSCNPEQHLNI